MSLQALLVSNDDAAVSAVSTVFSASGVSVSCCGHSDAQRAGAGRFDAVIVDFDEPGSAASLLQQFTQASQHSPITVALLSERSLLRNVLAAGANFVVYKPVTPEQAQSGLRAALLLLQRERRRSFRVPVQSPLQIKTPDGAAIEGILLDLSEEGLELMAAQPLSPAASVQVLFTLPANDFVISAQGEVAWANPNGQSGVRFVELPSEQQEVLKAWLSATIPEFPAGCELALPDCDVTDLSLGGCYVKSDSPFPERSGVEVELKAETMTVNLPGTVRVMHPGCGMGIEFVGNASSRAQLAGFIGFLASGSAGKPQVQIIPRNLSDDCVAQEACAMGEEIEDPLLELLQRHESITQEQFFEELQKQRCAAR